MGYGLPRNYTRLPASWQRLICLLCWVYRLLWQPTLLYAQEEQIFPTERYRPPKPNSIMSTTATTLKGQPLNKSALDALLKRRMFFTHLTSTTRSSHPPRNGISKSHHRPTIIDQRVQAAHQQAVPEPEGGSHLVPD